MKNILIYYRYFGYTLGGGEYLPLTFIAALQKKCRVTLALDWTEYFERAVHLMDVPIDLSHLTIVQVMPKGFHSTSCNLWQSFYRFRQLKQLAQKADICISLANIMDFGKPAHHFLITINLGDDAFEDYLNKRSNTNLLTRFYRFISASILRPLLGMRSKNAIIHNPYEHIYPNSAFVESLMKGFYGSFNSMVFYPPTVFTCKSVFFNHNPLSIIYLGRVSPQKRIIDIIEIVKRARLISGKELRLSLAGRLDEGPFKNRLMEIASTCHWIDFPGELYGEQKERFLVSATYAIHAMREEAFGISVTEYMKAGLIPLVPNEGGSCEVVDNPSLTFHDNEEAAQILVRLLSDNTFKEEQRLRCFERAKLFSKTAYLARQNTLLDKIVNSSI